MKLLVSSSVINFRERAEKTWKLERYKWPRDIFKTVCFMGMYHIGDYLHYILHLGKKCIFWCGSDIISLSESKIPWYLLFTNSLGNPNEEREHYVENYVEFERLYRLGIIAEIRPSFLDETIVPITYKHSDKPHVFLTSHPAREDEYGAMLVVDLAKRLPEITFHIYGVRGPSLPNIIFHGLVPEKQFNEEIKNYQCGLRTNEFDGNSEVTMRCLLAGGYPITRINYDKIDNYETFEELVALLKELKNKKEPNLEARDYWTKILNNYIWTK